MSFWEPTTIEAAFAKGEALGCEVIQANDFTLLLDLDTGTAQLEFCIDMLSIIVEHDAPESWTSLGGNMHVRIKLKAPLPAVTRYGLQACLGSDLLRELQNYRDLKAGIIEPCLLFKPKHNTGSLK